MDDIIGKSRQGKLKGEELDRPQWRTRFRRGCGLVV